jgi:hypothetical protein
MLNICEKIAMGFVILNLALLVIVGIGAIVLGLCLVFGHTWGIVISIWVALLIVSLTTLFPRLPV